MRKHDVRKWLHAILDLLPVILIPVFMVYSHRHELGISSTYTEPLPVYYQTNEVTNYSDLYVERIYHYSDDLTITGSHNTDWLFSIKNTDTLRILNIGANAYDISLYISGTNILNIRYYDDLGSHYLNIMNQVFDFVIDSFLSSFAKTQDIISSISSSNLLLVKEYQDVTYDFEKDIMGAFMNNFNFTINKYFNLGNVFNLGDVYTWFNTNIFGGNAPVVMYSVWNIVLYEFVMDLMFLLYGLFMWFIDMVEKLMEKPLKSVK